MSRTKADRLLRKVKNMLVEWKRWKGEEPKQIHLNNRDYVLLVDEGYIRDDMLSGTSIKVKVGNGRLG